MPRPKGSKNKKTVAKEKDFPAQIEAMKSDLASLDVAKAEQEAIIAAAQANLKVIRSDARKLETKIKKLEAKMAEEAAAAAIAETKKAIDSRIADMLSSGRQPDEILEALNKL